MPKPLVAVPTDIREFDAYVWHATPHQYLAAAVDIAEVTPLLVPSFGERLDLEALLDRVDGVMITGSKTNVHPSLYGQDATDANGPYDPDRDATSLAMIRLAVDKGIPLLAICRGIQEMNVALGGSLASEIQDLPGRSDHRGPGEHHDEKFAIRQPIRIAANSCLAEVFGEGEIRVNSVHRQAIDRLGERLQVEALADDGTVEAVSVRGSRAFAVGVQWHPEYWARTDRASGQIFRAFGDAARRYANNRGIQASPEN